jgi:hypothetical protein
MSQGEILEVQFGRGLKQRGQKAQHRAQRSCWPANHKHKQYSSKLNDYRPIGNFGVTVAPTVFGVISTNNHDAGNARK